MWLSGGRGCGGGTACSSSASLLARAPTHLDDLEDLLLILASVVGVEKSGAVVGRTVRVRFVQQRLNGGEYGGYIVGGTPSVL